LVNSFKKYSVLFLAPCNGIKPYVVIKLLETDLIDWEKSIVITNKYNTDSPLIKLIKKRKISHQIVQDKKLNNCKDVFSEYNPDFLVACGWGWKIPQEIIAIPKIGALNCHSSFLPDYKGSSVYQHYWANCEEEAGATIHYLEKEFDLGNIVAQQRMKIFSNDTPNTILWRTSELTASLLRESILLCLTGYKGMPQSGGRYFYKINKRKLIVHRLYNRLAKYFGYSRKLTPHKNIK